MEIILWLGKHVTGLSDEEEKYYGLDTYVPMSIGKKASGTWCNLFEGKPVTRRKRRSGPKHHYWPNPD
jgi:hypothetical protein